MKKLTPKESALAELVARYAPAFRIAGGLGRVKMPDGYALMFTEPGEGHYFGLAWDGTESCITVDKWSVYRWAKARSQPHTPTAHAVTEGRGT